MITPDDLGHWFAYHPPTGNQGLDYVRIREAAYTFAKVILLSTPPSADQTAAIRKLRECVMTANAAIACGGR